MKRTTTAGLALCVVAGLAALGWAHTGHSPSPPPTTVPATPEAAPPITSAVGEPEHAEVPPVTISPRDALLSHLHNKVVHFPLALGAAAALLLLLSRKWPQYEPAARLLLILAALGAVGAYFSGQAQEEAFEDGPLREYLERHELLGKVTGGTLWLGVALSFVHRIRPWLWIYALLLLGLLSATGFLGGILSHTEI